MASRSIIHSMRSKPATRRQPIVVSWPWRPLTLTPQRRYRWHSPVNAEGIEVRNCFWLPTRTPVAGSCISRTSSSICVRDPEIDNYYYIYCSFFQYFQVQSLRSSCIKLYSLSGSQIATYRKRFIISRMREKNIPCRRRKACECVAPSLFVVDC